MPKAKNAVWRFFASIKLALTILIILAAISIIGTLIKQGQDPSYYVREYGTNLSRLFEVLDIANMYSSWWFSSLLGLFALNLVVCSIERLPRVWHMVTLDNLDVDPQQLEKKSLTHRTETGLSLAAAADRVQRIMAGAGWSKSRRQDRKEAILFFAQKGSWSRLGVYLVHSSILIILIGAITGTFFGLKAYVFLPEGRSTDQVYLQKNQQPVPLGFEVRCDRYERSFYPNGMIKQYRIDLTVFDTERQSPFRESVIVNDPLSYRGFTFYQADSYPMKEFLVEIKKRGTNMEQAFRVDPARDVAWPGTDISFRIEDLKQDEDGAVRQAKILFKTEATAKPFVFWIKDQSTVTIRPGEEEFTFDLRQLYSNLVLVIKDPGILIVYSGCVLMVIGLSIVFFLSHRRVWVMITENENQREGSTILVSGTSNKNKPSFERKFQELVDHLGQDEMISSGKKGL
jgi:cytochrome c biogenesis protein